MHAHMCNLPLPFLRRGKTVCGQGGGTLNHSYSLTKDRNTFSYKLVALLDDVINRMQKCEQKKESEISEEKF